MTTATATPKPVGKGHLYFAGLFVVGLILNVVALYAGYWLGVRANKLLVLLGVSFGKYSWMALPFLLAILFWGLSSAAVIGGSVRQIGQFTGGHMLVTVLLAFTTIIGVNLLLAFNAVKTFPGLEVKNSYVASQEFNARKAEQVALGWNVTARHSDGVLTLEILGADGAPVQPARLEAVLGRATHVKDDKELSFTFDGSAFVTPVELAKGNWNIRMKAVADNGAGFQQRLQLHVK